MTDIRQRLLDAFAVEHREHLEAVRGMLRAPDRGMNDAGSIDLSELHRRLHSLKGAARATDLKPIETLAHRLETLASGVQRGTCSLDQETVKVIQASLDAIEDWFAAHISGGHEPDINGMIAAAEVAASGETVAVVSNANAPARREEKAAADTPSAPGKTTIQESVHVDISSLDRMLRSAGEISVAGDEIYDVGSRNAHTDAHLGRLAALVSRLQRETGLGAEGGAGVETVNRIGHELQSEIRVLSRDLRQANARQRERAWRFRQLSRRLREQVKHVRMVSADSVFGTLRKMVRDLALDEGKSIDLSLSGGGTRADRMVLQQLKDPLTHILRNAIVHGVEHPQEREKAGKPSTAWIGIDISAQGGHLVLQVEDDGRGLDFKAINQVARAKGILGEGERDIETYSDVQDILFEAGFSTTSSVDELSGRGVGMSVVQRTVTVLQGNLALSRGDGGGLAVTITVPLSVASTKVLVFKVGDAVAALPTLRIDRLYRVMPSELTPLNGQTVYTPEGNDEPISVFDLQSLFGVPSAKTENDGSLTLVVLRSGMGGVAIAIDAGVAVRDAVVEDVSAALPDNDLVFGTVVLEGGDVVPVLNPASLVSLFEESDGVSTSLFAEAEADVKRPTILVVDDSITTRTLEKSILEANGYAVRLSVDGIDALEQLRSNHVDLVVSDIEMPRMDGFNLLREVKHDNALHQIPVVLVTSRDNEEDRKRGLSLGADAYVVKQRFDQLDLLETIGQLL